MLLRILAWLGALLLQILGAMAGVFLLSVFFAGLNANHPAAWLFSLFTTWLGFTAGVYAAGRLAERLRWTSGSATPRLRLAATALTGLLPLLVLALFGLSAGPGTPAFTDLVLNTWQPRLSFFALSFAILGFHLAGSILKKR